jgi:hypothetical protein
MPVVVGWIAIPDSRLRHSTQRHSAFTSSEPSQLFQIAHVLIIASLEFNEDRERTASANPLWHGGSVAGRSMLKHKWRPPWRGVVDAEQPWNVNRIKISPT